MATDIKKIKLTVQKRIVIISIILLIGKFIAYFLTQSVGILTDALESIVNVIAGLITIYSLYISIKPRDDDHPFGHGKIESLSASIEGLLIIFAGLFIIYEAIIRLFDQFMPPKLDIGIIIVGVAGLINYVIGYYSIWIGKKNNSIALIAGGKHLQSDTYSSIGLVIGLIILLITKIPWIDSAIALIFGSIIIITGYKILKETISNLMDEADFSLLEKFKQIVWNNKSETWIDIHNLKIVKYGDTHHIDCDLRLPRYYNIVEAHNESDILKNIVEKNYGEKFDITIHIDACNSTFCKTCAMQNCTIREFEFENIQQWTIQNITYNSLKNS
jgi:cation diffusion facilitator family transporter